MTRVDGGSRDEKKSKTSTGVCAKPRSRGKETTRNVKRGARAGDKDSRQMDEG